MGGLAEEHPPRTEFERREPRGPRTRVRQTQGWRELRGNSAVGALCLGPESLQQHRPCEEPSPSSGLVHAGHPKNS